MCEVILNLPLFSLSHSSFFFPSHPRFWYSLILNSNPGFFQTSAKENQFGIEREPILKPTEKSLYKNCPLISHDENRLEDKQEFER